MIIGQLLKQIVTKTQKCSMNELWNKYVGQNNRMDYYQFNGVKK